MWFKTNAHLEDLKKTNKQTATLKPKAFSSSKCLKPMLKFAVCYDRYLLYSIAGFFQNAKVVLRTRTPRPPFYRRWFWNWTVVLCELFHRQTKAEVHGRKWDGMKAIIGEPLPSRVGINFIWKLSLHDRD